MHNKTNCALSTMKACRSHHSWDSMPSVAFNNDVLSLDVHVLSGWILHTVSSIVLRHSTSTQYVANLLNTFLNAMLFQKQRKPHIYIYQMPSS